jgi:hypothetical protein
MKNKLSDLNNHLFAQLERLGDENLKPDKLAQEIERGKAITGVAQQVIANCRLALDAQTALGEKQIPAIPKMLGIEHDGA